MCLSVLPHRAGKHAQQAKNGETISRCFPIFALIAYHLIALSGYPTNYPKHVAHDRKLVP